MKVNAFKGLAKGINPQVGEEENPGSAAMAAMNPMAQDVELVDPSKAGPVDLKAAVRAAAVSLAQGRLKDIKPFIDVKERSIENWIQIELAVALSETLGPVAVSMEASYPSPYSKQKCDIKLRRQGQAPLWVEIKHIWGWTQGKAAKGIKEDARRLERERTGPPDLQTGQRIEGVLVLFQMTRPDWHTGEFKQWLQAEVRMGRVILVEVP